MDDEPSIETEIAWESTQPRLDEAVIPRAAAAVLAAEGCRCARLSVAVVDDDAIAALHDRYLGLACPTDVLTFDLRDATDAGVSGEVVVSAETAARTAAALGHDAESELLLYVIHGILHLLGYDDKNAEQADVMRTRQESLLADLGYCAGPTEATA